MENPQLQKIEQAFVEQVFAPRGQGFPVVKCNAALYRRFSHKSPGFLKLSSEKPL